MKRKLSLLLAVVMVLGSFSFAFAAETTAEEEAGNFLMEQGVIEGINGELKLNDNFRRQDMVVMLSRLMGAEDIAEVYPTDELTFTDFTDPYYRPIIAWAVAEGLIEGHTPERFGFNEDVTAQQYATVLLRALGYGDEVAGDGYAKALDLAKELGLLGEYEFDNSTVVTRGQMYVLTVNALGTAMKDSEETLAAKLGVVMPEPEALEVVAAYSDNLKEVVVEFNKPVDTSTVTDDNVYIKNVEGTTVASEDGMSAVITVSEKLTNLKEYTVVVKGVKDTDGFEIAEEELAVKAFDATLPEALDIVVTGPKSFNIVFSEPIETKGTIKVTQGNTSIGNKVEVDGTNVVSVTVFRTLDDDEEYSVTVTDFKDYAEYKNVADTLTFVYEKDENPPVATVVKAEQTYVVVEFDKPVSGLSADKFYHTFTAWDAVGVYKNTDKDPLTEPTTKAYVYFYELDEDGKETSDSRPLPEGEVRFGINGSKIKDNWGNALGNVEFTVSVSADKTPLEVVDISVSDVKQLLVKFNKSVADFDKDNIEILDEDGEEISGLTWRTEKKNSKEWYVNLNKDLSGELVTIVIEDVQDTALVANKLSSYTDVIEITDKDEPAVSEVYYNIEYDDNEFENAELVVLFDEEVDGSTALVPSNYALVNGTSITLLTETPYFDLNNARVIIPLTEAQANQIKTTEKDGETTVTTQLQVINVEDLDGNAVIPALHAIQGEVKDATTTVTAKAEAISNDTVKVTIDDILSEVSEDDFELKVDDNKVDFALTQSEDGGKTILELVIDEDDVEISNNAGNVELSFVGDEENTITNSFGLPVEKIEFKDNKVFDKIVPTVVGIAEDEDEDGEIEVVAGNKVKVTKVTLTLVFSEDLDTENFFAPAWVDDFEIDADAAIKSYEVKDRDENDPANEIVLVITFEEALVAGDDVDLDITIVDEPRWLQDVAGNAVEGDTVSTTLVVVESAEE